MIAPFGRILRPPFGPRLAVAGDITDPTDIAGIKLWIDFSDVATLFTDAGSTPVANDDDKIYQANDKSGNAHHFTQTIEADRPLYKTGIQNTLSASRFDGANSWLSASRLYSDDDFSIFCVTIRNVAQKAAILAQHPGALTVGRTEFMTSEDNSPWTHHRLFFNNGSSYSVVSTTAGLDGTAHLLYSESNGAGSSHCRVDGGAAEGTLNGQTWTPYNTPFTIGSIADGRNTYSGDVLEIVCYSHLSDANRILFENYINTKWAL